MNTVKKKNKQSKILNNTLHINTAQCKLKLSKEHNDNNNKMTKGIIKSQHQAYQPHVKTITISSFF